MTVSSADVVATQGEVRRQGILSRVPGRTAAFAAAVGATLLWTRTMGDYGNGIVVVACINIMVVAGLHVLIHWGGQVSLGQVAFVAIGAFATARANADFGLPLPLAVVAGTLCAVIASAAVGIPALRLSGFALAIVTLAFGFAAAQWLFVQEWLVPVSTGLALRDNSLFGFALADSRALVIPLVLATSLVVGATIRLRASALGRSIQAVAEDEEVAAAYGVSIGAHKLVAFLIAGGCAGLAGAFTVMSIGRVGPTVFPATQSILYVSAVLLGGRGPLWGSLVAGASLGAFPIIAGGLGHYAGLIGPLGIVLVVRTSDEGINGMFRRSGAAARHLGRHVWRPQVDQEER